MEQMLINQLKKHSRNEEFFDDIDGQRWEDFKKSIISRGVVEPIVVTQDLVIVSGHQRVRACEELKLLDIPCRIKHYPEYDEKTNKQKEDMILEDLISTNIMQRGVGNVNPMKMAKCIMELERIKGIRSGRGGDKTSNPNNSDCSQKDLATQLGVNQDTITNYKKLLNLIPELQQMIENGSIKATAGYKIWSKMPRDEQEKFFNDIGREKIKGLTQKATQEYIDKVNRLQNELDKEKSKPPVVVDNVIDKTDYSLKDKSEKLQSQLDYITKLYDVAKEKEDTYKRQLELYKEDEEKYNSLTRQIELLSKEKDDIGRAVRSATELSGYIYEIENFLKDKLAPITYSRALLDCKDNPVVISNVTEIIEVVEKWCKDTRKQLPNIQQNIINVEVI